MNLSETNVSGDVGLLHEGQLPIVRAGNAWLTTLRAELGRLNASARARRQRIREIQELAAFSDRELWDLGLGRSDLLAIAQGVYRRD